MTETENKTETSSPTDGSYRPFSRLETRTQRVSELFSVLIALAGMFVQTGRLGAVAGVALVGLWLYLQVEFVFAAGTLLFVGLGGDPVSLGAILTLTGLGGLLAVDLARTWRSVRPVALFLSAFLIGTIGVLGASRTVAVSRLGVVITVGCCALAYGLYRYERYRFRVVVDEPTGRTRGRS